MVGALKRSAATTMIRTCNGEFLVVATLTGIGLVIGSLYTRQRKVFLTGLCS
jgi:hypothetical protein